MFVMNYYLLHIYEAVKHSLVGLPLGLCLYNGSHILSLSLIDSTLGFYNFLLVNSNTKLTREIWEEYISVRGGLYYSLPLVTNARIY